MNIMHNKKEKFFYAIMSRVRTHGEWHNTAKCPNIS